MTEVLDAWAIMAYLRNEPAADRVARAMARDAVMSGINLGEVFCVLHRLAGPGEAATTIRDLRADVDVETPHSDRVLEAVAIKAQHAMSYADAFAAATVLGHNATLLTGDPELLVEDASWRFEDLRASGG